jgi:ATP-dependent Clp protease ATP-binding subunit ClpA/ActR/RegA family two-component response regulator
MNRLPVAKPLHTRNGKVYNYSMLHGFDDEASRAWRYAKAHALIRQRAITIEDIYLGCVIVSHEASGDPLPDAMLEIAEQVIQHDVEAHKAPLSEPAKAFYTHLVSSRSDAISLQGMLQALPQFVDDSVREALRTLGVDLSLEAPPSAPMPIPARELQSVQAFVINLTQQAMEGRLSPAYERDTEREAMVLGLLSRTKPNVALVGPAGVGKTKLVEDLALRIANGEIPQLRGYTVLQLNLTALRAGAHMHGEVEQRFEQLRRLLENYSDRVILFIDELHTIVGTQIGGHTLDVANALKPMLAAGKIRCIGATTRQEYIQYIEADRALARRFSVVNLQEPSTETMRRILREVRPHYEQHHRVRYLDESLETILELCERFMPARHYPDKALDLLDAAGAWTALHGEGAPPTVRPQEVYQSLAKRMQIPIDELAHSTYHDLATHLGTKVLGQEHALRLIEDAVNERFSVREGVSGVRLAMVFAGPPSVGKTLTARELALRLCHNDKAFLELNLRSLVRRYQQGADELDSLIGVKPPYVGWERGGVLTNHVINFPRCVIYVRGIEDATPAVQDLFGAILEKGECEDGRGQQVTFREATLIFAFDMNADEDRRIGFGRADRLEASSDPTRLMRLLENLGAPEAVLDGVHAIVPFQPLTAEALRRLAQRALEQLRERIHKQFGKTLDYDLESLTAWLLQTQDEPLTPEDILRKVERSLIPAIKRAMIQLGEQWASIPTVRVLLQADTPLAEPICPRLMVYDDVADFYEELRAHFPDYIWFYASTETEAAAIIERERPHIVLIDTCLSVDDASDTGGLTILRLLKARYPEPVYLLVTAQSVSFETTRDAFRAGAYDYLYRPTEESVLRQLAQSLAEREMQQLLLRYQKEIFARYPHFHPTIFPEQGVVQISLLEPESLSSTPDA